MKLQTSFALLGCAALSCLMPLTAQASCYGSGFSRFCDGIGGPGATYSRPSSNGLTDYYGSNGLNRTVIRSSPSSFGSSQSSDLLQILETLRY
jgi:hypothetical protein